jgi:hypothetical protein
MSSAVEEQETLALAWGKFESLSARLSRYLKTSEAEFGQLIQALDACWTLVENVRKATAGLAELAASASATQNALRDSLRGGCAVLRASLQQIRVVSRHLASATQEAAGILRTSNHIEQNLAPLKYIAFHFRLQGAGLSSENNAAVMNLYAEMLRVVDAIKRAGDSQQRTLVSILDKLTAATQLIEQASASYSSRATESEAMVERNLALLLEVPSDLLRMQNKADALASVAANGVREAVKALQGHDSIRQRLEHVLAALDAVRQHQGNESGHALLLQRHQAKSVQELIVKTGSRIERELNNVIGCAQGVAGNGEALGSEDEEVKKFERAADGLTLLNSKVAELLAGEAKIGAFVLERLVPIRELLRARSGELEAPARSMKRVALNVLISAEKIPSVPGIAVLGEWTSETAGYVLQLQAELNEHFAQLSATLQAQGAVIEADIHEVDVCRGDVADHRSDGAFRNSRRRAYDEVNRLTQEATQLQQKTEGLVQSLRFVDEGTGLLEDLEGTIDVLLTLYPESATPFDLDAASAGYTMQEQHDAHALMSGKVAQTVGRLTEPGEGQDLGANVELF